MPSPFAPFPQRGSRGTWRRHQGLVRMTVVLGCLMIAGCPGSDSGQPDPIGSLPYRGVNLRFVVPRSLQLADQWAPAINDWQDEQAASVEVLVADLHEPTAEWVDMLSYDPTTLVLLPTAQLGELVGAGLAATAVAVEEGDAANLPPTPSSLRTAVAMLGDEQAFVVATNPTPVVVVRNDLLQAAGRTAPTTWEEYDRLIVEREQWAPNHVAVEPRGEATVATLFLARALSAAKHPSQFSVELDVSSGDPLIASAPYVRVLEEMQALTPHLAENVGNMSPADCLQALADERAAIGIVWSPAADVALPSMTEAERSATLSFHPLPGRREVFDRDQGGWSALEEGNLNRPALCGFSGYSVAVTNVGTATDQAAAWDLWSLLARYQTDATIAPLRGGDIVGRTATDDVLLDGLSPAEAASCRDALFTNLQNSLLVCELPMFGRTQMRAALAGAIQQALKDDLDPEATLQQVQQAWSKIIEELGRTRVLNSYRLRLGLVPVPG